MDTEIAAVVIAFLVGIVFGSVVTSTVGNTNASTDCLTKGEVVLHGVPFKCEVKR